MLTEHAARFVHDAHVFLQPKRCRAVGVAGVGGLEVGRARTTFSLVQQEGQVWSQIMGLVVLVVRVGVRRVVCMRHAVVVVAVPPPVWMILDLRRIRMVRTVRMVLVRGMVMFVMSISWVVCYVSVGWVGWVYVVRMWFLRRRFQCRLQCRFQCRLLCLCRIIVVLLFFFDLLSFVFVDRVQAMRYFFVVVVRGVRVTYAQSRMVDVRHIRS